MSTTASSSSLSPSEALAFAIVVAADEDGGIGVDGDLPWRLPGDLRRFKALTTGDGNSAVIMGRRTWASIPDRFRPLPKRLNIVLSRTPQALALPDGVRAAGSLEEALEIAADADERFVIGGAQVYRAALAHPGCRVVHLTRVLARFTCDTFFALPAGGFTRAGTSETRDDNGVSYVFERWEAAGPGARVRADMGALEVVHLPDETWSPSPTPGVDRRRLDRVGDEVARATSIVRYAPHSRFPAHSHGAGEEYLVLDGVFRDEHGVYPPGTYVRNPWGTSHAPFTGPEGCTILVKLRQMDAADQTRVVADTETARLAPGERAGVVAAELHRFDTEQVSVESWAPGSGPHAISGAELLVVRGDVQLDGVTHPAQTWVRVPRSRTCELASANGAWLWIKRGHLGA